MPILIRLLEFLKPYKLKTVWVTIAAILTSAFALASPQIIGWMFDNPLKHLADPKQTINVTNLIVAGLAILGTSLLRGFFYYVQQYEGETLSQQMAYDIRNQIYDRLQRLS